MQQLAIEHIVGKRFLLTSSAMLGSKGNVRATICCALY